MENEKITRLRRVIPPKFRRLLKRHFSPIVKDYRYYEYIWRKEFFKNHEQWILLFFVQYGGVGHLLSSRIGNLMAVLVLDTKTFPQLRSTGAKEKL